MLFTTHALTGAAIGVLSGNPIAGFFLGFLSHHILDAIPHFDQGSLYISKDKGPVWAGAKYEEAKKFRVKRDWILLFIDMGIASALSLYILSNSSLKSWPLFILGAAGGLLPDILDVSPFWRDRFRALAVGKIFHKFHDFFHWPLTLKYWHLGIGIQIVIVGVVLFLLVKKFI